MLLKSALASVTLGRCALDQGPGGGRLTDVPWEWGYLSCSKDDFVLRSPVCWCLLLQPHCTAVWLLTTHDSDPSSQGSFSVSGCFCLIGREKTVPVCLWVVFFTRLHLAFGSHLLSSVAHVSCWPYAVCRQFSFPCDCSFSVKASWQNGVPNSWTPVQYILHFRIWLLQYILVNIIFQSRLITFLPTLEVRPLNIKYF